MGCTFCAIPQFRGRHRSRPLADIVKEVEGLAARGIQEAILVSQDTLAYGRDIAGNGDIADLLLALGETRIPWIRQMYLHPAHVNDRLVERWARARVVPYLDMPVQHGDDGVLKAMRRAVTATRMKEIVRAFREAIPRLTVRTTVLVGFPGESEAAFQNLLEFLDEVRFDRLGVFTYSAEEGTPSPAYPDQVAAEVAAERAAIVQEYQDRLASERRAALAGAVTLAGTWAAHRAERLLGAKDPGAIVIDEVAGMTLTVLPFPPTVAVLAVGLVLFRIFDIIKPFPARASERAVGGIGVMVDDLIAALYALAVIAIGRATLAWP